MAADENANFSYSSDGRPENDKDPRNDKHPRNEGGKKPDVATVADEIAYRVIMKSHLRK